MLLTSLERKGSALEFNYVYFDHLHGHHHYRLLDLDHESSELQYDGRAIEMALDLYFFHGLIELALKPQFRSLGVFRDLFHHFPRPYAASHIVLVE